MGKSWAQRAVGLVAAIGICVTGCGDIGAVLVELEFPDEQTESITQALLYRAREVPFGRDGCADLWNPGQPANLAQSEAIVPYPNRIDVRALGIDLAPYESLNVFVFAYATANIQNEAPIAGGCVEAPVSGDSTNSIVIPLQLRP